MMDRTLVPRRTVGRADVVERVRPARGAVDELIDDHEVAGMDVGLQRAARARADQRPHAERCHRPDVGPVRHAVRGVLVAPPVTGEEGDPSPGQFTDGDRRCRATEGSLDLDVGAVGQELVEAGPADDPDLGAQLGCPIAERDQHRRCCSVARRLRTTTVRTTTVTATRYRRRCFLRRSSTTWWRWSTPPSPSGESPVAALARGLLGGRTAVGLVEAVALERDTDRQEHLLDGHRRTGLRMDVLGQRVVGERLLDLDRLVGVDELVHVRRHGSGSRYRPGCPGSPPTGHPFPPSLGRARNAGNVAACRFVAP